MMSTREKVRVSRAVRALDTEAALPLVGAVYEALYGESLPGHTTVAEQVILVGWNEKESIVDVANVHTEGVGLWITDENCVEVWVNIGMHLSNIPLGLNRIPLREGSVDLAEHVRSFGSRLESNWHLWERAAAKALDEGVPDYYRKFLVTA